VLKAGNEDYDSQPVPKAWAFLVYSDTFNVSRQDDLVLAAVVNKGAKTQQPWCYGFSPGLF